MVNPENPFASAPSPGDVDSDKEAVDAVADAERMAGLDSERVADEVELAEMTDDTTEDNLPMAA